MSETGIGQSAFPFETSLTWSALTSPITREPLRQSCGRILSSRIEPNIHWFCCGVWGTCCPSVGIR